jgi:hypothetical protein
MPDNNSNTVVLCLFKQIGHGLKQEAIACSMLKIFGNFLKSKSGCEVEPDEELNSN